MQGSDIRLMQGKRMARDKNRRREKEENNATDIHQPLIIKKMSPQPGPHLFVLKL
jgi:hypothetical protein